jgi:uridine kinase
MDHIRELAETIIVRRRDVPSGQALLVAVSGIDGSGKGYVTSKLVAELQARKARAVGINIDGWLNLPAVRFNRDRPAVHFYHHAIRFADLFEQLVLPLKRQRSICVEANFAEETADQYRRHTYEFHNVDVIVPEGIFLLKRDLVKHYDWKVWLECSFETALERALARGQEGLPPDETIRAYRTIYFPAQELHFRLDNPHAAADAVLVNDPAFTKPASAATLVD